jgi:hypothetical protein
MNFGGAAITSRERSFFGGGEMVEIADITDRIVAAIHASDAPTILASARQHTEEVGHLRCSWIDGGTFVDNGSVPEGVQHWVEQWGEDTVLTEERADEVFQNPEKLSFSEFRWFVQQGAEGLFTDYPEDPVWRVIELRASDGRTAYWSQWV